MKKSLILFVVLGVVVVACSTSDATTEHAPAPPVKQDMSAYGSLLGTYIDSTSSDKYTVYEEWASTNDSTFTGLGCAVAGNDTVFLENITLSRKAGMVNYSVHSASENNGEWVPFEHSEGADTLFVFTNPRHDWPQRIAYHKREYGWHVDVSGKDHDTLRVEEFRLARR